MLTNGGILFLVLVKPSASMGMVATKLLWTCTSRPDAGVWLGMLGSTIENVFVESSSS